MHFLRTVRLSQCVVEAISGEKKESPYFIGRRMVYYRDATV